MSTELPQQVGVYVRKSIRAALAEAARERGVTISTFVRSLLEARFPEEASMKRTRQRKHSESAQ